jgi:hypothetical protein
MFPKTNKNDNLKNAYNYTSFFLQKRLQFKAVCQYATEHSKEIFHKA